MTKVGSEENNSTTGCFCNSLKSAVQTLDNCSNKHKRPQLQCISAL